MNAQRITVISLFAALVALFFILDLGRLLTFASLKANHGALLAFYDEHRILTVAMFLAVYVIQTALSLPGATILSLAAGALFGAAAGTAWAVTGATIGATLAFLLTRYLFHDAVQRRFGPRLERINRELEKAGLNYLLFLRLVPLFPFFLINLGAGLTRLPLRTFVLGTFVGIIPGGFVYVNAGASLAAIASPADIASPRVIGSFALLGLFSLVPALYKNITAQRRT